MAKRKPKLTFPDRKISDTLLRFADPILDVLGPDITEAEMERVLMVAWMAWNAVVYADVVGKRDLLDQFYTAMAHEPELKRFAGGKKRGHCTFHKRTKEKYSVPFGSLWLSRNPCRHWTINGLEGRAIVLQPAADRLSCT